MLSRFIHMFVRIGISFFLLAEYGNARMFHNLFYPFTTNGHFGSSQSGEIVSKAAVQVLLWTGSSSYFSWVVLRRRVAG